MPGSTIDEISYQVNRSIGKSQSVERSSKISWHIHHSPTCGVRCACSRQITHSLTSPSKFVSILSALSSTSQGHVMTLKTWTNQQQSVRCFIGSCWLLCFLPSVSSVKEWCSCYLTVSAFDITWDPDGPLRSLHLSNCKSTRRRGTFNWVGTRLNQTTISRWVRRRGTFKVETIRKLRLPSERAETRSVWMFLLMFCWCSSDGRCHF